MFPGLSIDRFADQPIQGWLKIGVFADTRIVEIASAPKRFALTVRNDACDLELQLAGSGRCRHAGREAAWYSGDLVMLDGVLPFEAVHPASYYILIWRLPREALAPMLAASDCPVSLRIPGTDGLGTVLGNYARMLASEADRLDAITQRSLLSHLCSLVALTASASPIARESRREIRRAVWRQRIFTYIETHLRDSGLTAERAAHDLRISKRWLHALLEDGKMSFAAWVVRRRLEECRRLLDDPADDHLSVTEIAYLLGFNDLSTFNRRFRVQYGMTPRDARHIRDGASRSDPLAQSTAGSAISEAS